MGWFKKSKYSDDEQYLDMKQTLDGMTEKQLMKLLVLIIYNHYKYDYLNTNNDERMKELVDKVGGKIIRWQK